MSDLETKSNTLLYCEYCDVQYTKSNKTHHFKTNTHQYNKLKWDLDNKNKILEEISKKYSILEKKYIDTLEKLAINK